MTSSPPYCVPLILPPFVQPLLPKPSLKAGVTYKDGLTAHPADNPTATPSSGFQPASYGPRFGVGFDNRMALARSCQDLFSNLPPINIAGKSVSELSTLGLTTSINLVQILKAFQYQQQLWERTGTIILQTGLNWFLLDKITSSTNSLSSAVLDYTHFNKDTAYPHIAPVKAKDMSLWDRPKRIPEHIAHWTHDNIQMPVQRRFGMEGNFRADVLRPAALPHDTKWLEMSKNEIGTIELRIKQMQGSEVAAAMNKAVDKLDSDGNTPEVATKAKDRLINDIDFALNQLRIRFSPTETLHDAAKEIIKTYTVEHQLGDKEQYIPKAQEQLGDRLVKLFHLHDMLPHGNPSAIKEWVQTHVTQPQQEGKSFEDKDTFKSFERYLKEADKQWESRAKSKIEEAKTLVGSVFDKVVDTVPHGSMGKAEACETLNKHKEQLIHVGKDQAITGELANILEPVFKLNTRKKLMQGFLERSTHCIMAQLALLTVATVALQGKALMWVVFHTFAKLDDPSHKPNKELASKLPILHLSKALSPAALKASSAPVSSLNKVAKPQLLPDTVPPLQPSLPSATQQTGDRHPQPLVPTPPPFNGLKEDALPRAANPYLLPLLSVRQPITSQQESVQRVN